MKGVVFTEFLEMVEDQFGYETADAIIVKSKVPSEGAYTAVGTYPSSEIFALVSELSINQNIPIPTLLNVFGKYLFHRFAKVYSFAFEGMNSAFELLQKIEHHIHVEVQKLYPDAELPTFRTEKTEENQLVMYYHSERSMGDLAVGLIQGCLEHFEEKGTIVKENETEDGKNVKFTITKH